MDRPLSQTLKAYLIWRSSSSLYCRLFSLFLVRLSACSAKTCAASAVACSWNLRFSLASRLMRSCRNALTLVPGLALFYTLLQNETFNRQKCNQGVLYPECPWIELVAGMVCSGYKLRVRSRTQAAFPKIRPAGLLAPSHFWKPPTNLRVSWVRLCVCLDISTRLREVANQCFQKRGFKSSLQAASLGSFTRADNYPELFFLSLKSRQDPCVVILAPPPVRRLLLAVHLLAASLVLNNLVVQLQR